MTYTPATQDQLLAIRVNAGIEELAQSERFAAAEPDMVEAIVSGIGEFAAGEWAPLNRVGDLEGARLENGTVHLPDGFAEAYEHYVEQGWNAIAGPVEFGGQGLPFTLSCNVLENLGTANMAFNLLPMLSVGAMESLEHHGSKELQEKYLPKLVSGEWSGTMNLTEPQAGSDVGALRTTAHPIEDGEHAGKYRIKGQKIYITWGEHELAKNIIHLVLARVPDAPEGSRGISLFIVPKYHVEADGSLGKRNDVRCVSIEHKLGINASPTCVMSYGDEGECIGELVGAENRGLMAMFTMMNNARINVGNQGVQIGERATQQAQMYARERIQSARAGSPDKAPVAILEHPDVRRMLLRMKALTEGARALLYYTAGQVDRGTLGNDDAKARGEVLTPLIKAWGTDIGIEVASLGVQVHGGMGFVEETGAAQHWRDSRIAPIYEGTNGIQAMDLVGRKLALKGGQLVRALFAELTGYLKDNPEAPYREELKGAIKGLEQATLWLAQNAPKDPEQAGAAATPYLRLMALTVIGYLWSRMAGVAGQQLEAGEGNKPLLESKQASARFYFEKLMPETDWLLKDIQSGKDSLMSLSDEHWVA
ncbi:MAG TPA: acyl-CoA dehydrogenase [Erythrobacter sp.]|nr:acyl-CoA dehydrogenase [Erythrobacter sp.]